MFAAPVCGTVVLVARVRDFNLLAAPKRTGYILDIDSRIESGTLSH